MTFIKTILVGASVVALAACSQADAPTTSTPTSVTEAVTETVSNAAEAMPVKTKAVLIYADWCGSCKVLDPKVKAAQAMSIPGVDFVTLDYTDKDEAAFYAAADAAGVGEAITAYLDGTVKTGQLLLVDLDDQKVLTKVTKTFETPDIAQAVKDAVTAS